MCPVKESVLFIYLVSRLTIFTWWMIKQSKNNTLSTIKNNLASCTAVTTQNTTQQPNLQSFFSIYNHKDKKKKTNILRGLHIMKMQK